MFQGIVRDPEGPGTGSRGTWGERRRDRREALRSFRKLDATRWQYTHGVKDVDVVSPDAWTTDQYLLDRERNADIPLDLFLS